MWKKILGGLVVLIVIVVSLAMYATSGMTEVVNEFFIHVKTKHYSDAYNMLSEDFKQSTSQEEFKNFVIKNALINYKEANWDSRSVENNIGKLEGSITTKSGGTIPLTIQLIKHGETWQIYSIFKPASGFQTENKPEAQQTVKPSMETTIPNREMLLSMIQKGNLVFANAVNDKSMSKLYGYIASFWQQRTTIKALDEAFNVFYQAQIDLTVLKNFTPILDKDPVLTKDGELILVGHYPTSPSVVYFEHSYIKENGVWKMIGININIK